MPAAMEECCKCWAAGHGRGPAQSKGLHSTQSPCDAQHGRGRPAAVAQSTPVCSQVLLAERLRSQGAAQPGAPPAEMQTSSSSYKLVGLLVCPQVRCAPGLYCTAPNRPRSSTVRLELCLGMKCRPGSELGITEKSGQPISLLHLWAF